MIVQLVWEDRSDIPGCLRVSIAVAYALMRLLTDQSRVLCETVCLCVFRIMNVLQTVRE